MEIRVLRYFLTIAREGSITSAAEQLHITQPTLSRQIKDLEDELGQKLFHRSSHSMKLTQEGFIFRKRAEEIVAMVDKTSAEFLSMDNDTPPVLRATPLKRGDAPEGAGGSTGCWILAAGSLHTFTFAH